MSNTVWAILAPILGMAFACSVILGLTVLATAYEPSPTWHPAWANIQ